MDPSSLEYLAESSETISVVPNFSDGVMYFLSGDVGPFRAGLPLEVPLWVAAHLRQQRRCRIIQPEWLDPEK